MKIVRIIARLNVGGPARHVIWLTRSLETDEFQSVLVAGSVPEGEHDMAWLAEQEGVVPELVPELSREPLAKNRIVADVAEVPRRRPDIILGSWCGKKFQPRSVRARPGWDAVPAVVNGDLYEIKSSIILQPGPAALTDGVDAIHAIIARWSKV